MPSDFSDFCDFSERKNFFEAERLSSDFAPAPRNDLKAAGKPRRKFAHFRAAKAAPSCGRMRRRIAAYTALEQPKTAFIGSETGAGTHKALNLLPNCAVEAFLFGGNVIARGKEKPLKMPFLCVLMTYGKTRIKQGRGNGCKPATIWKP